MAAVSERRTNSKWQIYLMYGLLALLSLAFIMAGGSKLLGQEMHVENFIRWGYPVWFMYLTGLIEVSSVILMWIPKTRLYGALGLAGVMTGASATHIVNSEPEMLPITGTLLVLAGIVAWFNRPATDKTGFTE